MDSKENEYQEVEHASKPEATNPPNEKELSIIETVRQQPKQILWCLFAVWTCLLVSFENQAAGMVLAIPRFREDFGREYAGDYVLNTQWQSAFNAGPIAASIIGTFGAAYVADKIGRKPVFITGILASFAAVALEFVATTEPVFFGGKFINGWTAGVLLAVAVTYIGEVSPNATRGVLTCLTALMMTLGPLAASIIIDKTGNSPTRWAYRAVFCSQFAFGGIALLPAPFLPESPVWCLSAGKEEKATRMLRRLGVSESDIPTHIASIRTTLQHTNSETNDSNSATFLDCLRRTNLRRTLISIMPLATQALGGVYFISSYGTYYMQLAGYDTAASFKLQITQHGLAMAGNICSWFLVDRVGRRPLTVYGHGVVTLILLLVATLGTVGTPTAIKTSVGFIVMYNFFYNISIGATAYTLLCEVATSRLRVKTISIGIAVQYAIYCVWAFVIPYMFNPDKGDLGAKTAYLFGGLGVLLFVGLWVWLPETAGRTFEELDELFGRGVSGRGFKGAETVNQGKGRGVQVEEV
ncbi:general substrate transporter [Aspergillus karnatakaensis]|uniref:general substrate transporter n=1 Tax=Aspergillus karnatakaensis TaxID=1810916 RepID=UPI003CCD60A3